MARIEVVMPQMGESITEGTIVKWHKKIGDPVKKDETLLEISTDKVDSEIPSPASGVLAANRGCGAGDRPGADGDCLPGDGGELSQVSKDPCRRRRLHPLNHRQR